MGDVTRAPIGWVEFCVEYDPECKTTPSAPRDVVLSADAWKDLQRVNLWVNTNIKPMTDMDHWGVVERWNYPDDGYGDCEDYVLQKRRMLIKAGWPREALLITVVRDRNGDGHAVLTVKTDKGEFILDNQRDEIVALDRDRLPLREAPVASGSECVGFARHQCAGAGDSFGALNRQTQGATRARSRPHPSPSPDRVRARPALPQELAAPFLGRCTLLAMAASRAGPRLRAGLSARGSGRANPALSRPASTPSHIA